MEYLLGNKEGNESALAERKWWSYAVILEQPMHRAIPMNASWG